MLEAFNLEGEWQCNSCDEWLNGSLSYNTESGALLVLHGTFNSFLYDRSSRDIIIGKTIDGEVTLIDSWYIKSTTHNSTEITISKYKPSIILVGHLFTTDNCINFNRVVFKLFNLYNWFALTGKSVDFQQDEKGFSIKYEKSPEIDFSINENCNGNFSFDGHLISDSKKNKSEIHEDVSIILEYKKAIHYKLILDDIFKFVRFVTLFTFEQSYPISITLKSDELKRKVGRIDYIKPVNCFYQNNYQDDKHKVRLHFEHLVKYDAITGKLPEILKNWFRINNEIEDVILLLTNYFKNKYRFSSDTFMDCVRALESYHRTYYNNNRIPEQKLNRLVELILDQVELETDDNEWLKQRLKGNEPNLRIRLKELLKKNKNKFTESIPKVGKFCQHAIVSRNYYTHYDIKSKSKALSGKQLSELTFQIRGILISALLVDLGLSNEQFEDGLKYHLL